MGAFILDKLKVNSGDHIALIYPPGIELIVAFYGCLYVGEWSCDHLMMSYYIMPYGRCSSLQGAWTA